MNQLPLSLGVRHNTDAKGAVLKNRPLTAEQIQKTLSRDKFTCRCCGFISRKFHRVVFQRDLDPKASERNLVTLCTFCEMTTALDRAGLTGAGYIIWLPELSQIELSSLVRALFVARAGEDTALAETARRMLDVLTARRAEAKKRLGTDDPLLLATALHEMVNEKPAARAPKLEGLRFLPLDRYFVANQGKDVNMFPSILDYWVSPEGPFGQTPVSTWPALFEKRIKAAQDQT
ncbi:MAG: hypothetical protein FWF24_00765 [Alphaproteobacteria bacterium]|nr:hypothetical protein [Alphaproteobacteria bacterium]